MKDRVSLNPGRVLVTPENGGEAFYVTLTRADNPTQEGDPLSKATFLKDGTAALFGLDATAVPDDVFILIKTLIDAGALVAVGTYIGTGGTVGESNPTSLTFGFKPVFVEISTNDAASQTSNTVLQARFISSVTEYPGKFPAGNSSTNSNGMISGIRHVTFGNDGISWYDSLLQSGWFFRNGSGQINLADTTYYYFAIGFKEE